MHMQVYIQVCVCVPAKETHSVFTQLRRRASRTLGPRADNADRRTERRRRTDDDDDEGVLSNAVFRVLSMWRKDSPVFLSPGNEAETDEEIT